MKYNLKCPKCGKEVDPIFTEPIEDVYCIGLSAYLKYKGLCENCDTFFHFTEVYEFSKCTNFQIR